MIDHLKLCPQFIITFIILFHRMCFSLLLYNSFLKRSVVKVSLPSVIRECTHSMIVSKMSKMCAYIYLFIYFVFMVASCVRNTHEENIC
jgi:hypothetical protein